MSRVGNAYGQGLYALAKEEMLEETIFRQILVLKESFDKEPAFLRLLASSNIPKAERTGVLDDSFRDKIHPYVLNFLKILTEKGYIRHFSDCCKAYRTQYYEDKGILPVRAISAIELTPEQKQRLIQKLTGITGKKIDLECRVDPSVLGGIRLDYGGVQVDGTVQGRLEAIEKRLKNTQL